MWARLQRFSELPRPAKAIFLRAALLLPVLSISLRFRGFRATHRVLQRLLSPATSDPIQENVEGYTAMTVRMLMAAARHSPFPSTCLERSLVLWWLLARRGIATQLRIGVRKDASKFTAHAWVELGGVAVAEPEAPHLHYAAFAEEMLTDDTAGGDSP